MIAAAETVSLHDTVTNRIIRELEQGCIPWVQPWASSGMTPLGLPLNAATGRPYSGVNILLLWFAAIEQGRAELAEAARRVSQQLGVPVLTQHRGSVEGAYVQRVDLAQGRMAIILQERQAFIVPWRPTLERFAGREVRGAIRGNGLSWALSSKRSQSLPPM